MTAQVSVIICTRNRANALQASLDSVLAAFDAAPHVAAELIVVDNGSSDNTAATVAAWISKTKINARLIPEPRAGLSIARNTGVASATGEIIAFTDDDCCLESNYLAQLVEIYSRYTEPVIIGGRVELGDPRDLPMTIKTDPEPATFDGIDIGSFIIGCNLTLNRAVWDAIGLMDTRFGAGGPFKASEETDYLYRAYRAGIPLHYRPELVVHHFHGRRTPDDVRKLWRNYSIGGGALFAKYFGSPLSRQFRWNCKNALKEMFGLARLEPENGLTFRAMAAGNIEGMWLYWRSTLSKKPANG